ncbi:MAG: DUF4252 domain-containing protein [Porphyromonas sp.]|nr:DUF4252 domain-containing protein [Porphyromonas sp.]
MKQWKHLWGACLMALVLLATSVNLSAQKLDYSKLDNNPNVERVKLSGMMLKMGLAVAKKSNAEGRKAAEAFRNLKTMYVFTSENKTGKSDILKAFAPLLSAEGDKVEELLDQKEAQDGERVRIFGIKKGSQRFSTLLILTEEKDEAVAVVFEGDMHKDDLMTLAKSAMD